MWKDKEFAVLAACEPNNSLQGTGVRRSEHTATAGARAAAGP